MRFHLWPHTPCPAPMESFAGHFFLLSHIYQRGMSQSDTSSFKKEAQREDSEEARNIFGLGKKTDNEISAWTDGSKDKNKEAPTGSPIKAWTGTAGEGAPKSTGLSASPANGDIDVGDRFKNAKKGIHDTNTPGGEAPQTKEMTGRKAPWDGKGGEGIGVIVRDDDRVKGSSGPNGASAAAPEAKGTGLRETEDKTGLHEGEKNDGLREEEPSMGLREGDGTEEGKERLPGTAPEEESEPPFEVDDGRKAEWSRTLRDIGVAGLDVGSSLLQAAEKQYGAVVKLTQQMMQGKPMSLPSQALTATMTGLGTVNEVADDAAQKLGVKPGVDPEKLRDQLAIKGPEYYRQKDLAQRATQYITKEFNDAVEEAAAGKDLTQLTDTELEQVYNRMERTFRPEYDRIVSTPQDQWTQSDRVFYNSYVAMNQGIGRRAKAIGREQRAQVRDLKQQQKEDRQFLEQNKSEWYRSGEMKDPKDIQRYKRELENKIDTGADLTEDEKKDYDDISMKYGWRTSARSQSSDLRRTPHRRALWSQHAGTKLSRNIGGDKEVLKMYQLARKGDIGALKAMLDTPEKKTAASGFARMAYSNQMDPTLRTMYPMSDDDIVLGYAIYSALSGEKFAPPVKPAGKMTVPKWMTDKQAAEKAAEAKKQAEIARKQRTEAKKQAEQPVQTPQEPVETKKRPPMKRKKPLKEPLEAPKAAETVEEPVKPVETRQTGQESPYSEGLEHTAEQNFGRDDYYLKAQKQNLAGMLAGMDENDPDYPRIRNLKNQADAEHLLHYLVRNNAPERQQEFARKILDEYRRGWVPVELASKGGTPAKQARALFTPAKPARKAPVKADKVEQPQEEAVQEPAEPTISEKIAGFDPGLKDKDVDGKMQYGFRFRAENLKNGTQRDALLQDIKAKGIEAMNLKKEAEENGASVQEIENISRAMDELGDLYSDVEIWSEPKPAPVKSKEDDMDEVPSPKKASSKKDNRAKNNAKIGAQKVGDTTVDDILSTSKDIKDFVAQIEKASGKTLTMKEVQAYEKYYRIATKPKRNIKNKGGSRKDTSAGKFVSQFNPNDDKDNDAQLLRDLRGRS